MKERFINWKETVRIFLLQNKGNKILNKTISFIKSFSYDKITELNIAGYGYDKTNERKSNCRTLNLYYYVLIASNGMIFVYFFISITFT